MFELLDVDGDGYLGKEEFVGEAKELFASQFKQQVAFVFRLCDFDGDGAVSREDLSTVLSHVPLAHILPEKRSRSTSEGQYTKTGGG